MFYLSSKHHFDTMFVILCVVAGAISHNISNTSKIPINQLNNHYRPSFIDFILDDSLLELLQSPNTINKDSAPQHTSNYKSSAAKNNQQIKNICALLSNALSEAHFKFCRRYQDVLEIILPEIIQLTKEECTRLTTDLRWNCSAIDFYLDRTNQLAFTKEAALIRAILNASMVYLVVKTCAATSHRSCGCQNNQRYSLVTNDLSRITRGNHWIQSERDIPDIALSSIDQQNLSYSDIQKLDAGSPLRLTKSVDHQQGCSANVAFGYIFTKVFIDSDDTKSLNKAYRILNEERNYNGITNNKSRNFRRLLDSDYKDLAFIKWTKSAVNLHNNHLGRQMVHKAIQKRCRCHGVSGSCQFQTCWDHLSGFDVIASRLKSIYLAESVKVESKNSGSYDKPELSLAHFNQAPSSAKIDARLETMSDSTSESVDISAFLANSSIFTSDQLPDEDRVRPGELLYLYDSPEYCEPLLKIRHIGTKGRSCVLSYNINISLETSKKTFRNTEAIQAVDKIETKQESFYGAPGLCAQLCCNRGYHSELVFDMVACNCRFKFCCKIECDNCLKQRLQHYCL